MSNSVANRIGKSLIYLIKENDRIKKEYKREKNNVILGRKFQLGSIFQYELAKELFQKTDYTALVDYPISFKYRGKNKTLYPDILILKGGKLKGVIEVKIDLGYLKIDHFGIEYNKKTKKYKYKISKNKFRKNYANLLSSDKFSYKYKQNDKKERRFVNIPRNTVKIMIIVTKHNDHNRYDYFKNSMYDSNFKVLKILEKQHPNHDDCDVSAIKNEIRENEENFNKAFKGLFG